MTPEFYSAAFITVLITMLTQAAQVSVSASRRKFGIPLPSVTGHIEFERFHRAHANQIERNVVFLPVLWLSSMAISWVFILPLGLIWVILRAIFVRAYATDNKKLRMIGGIGDVVPTAILFVMTVLVLAASFFGFRF